MVTYHVKVTGDDITGTGTEGNPWRTITFGLTNLAAGAGAFDSSPDELLVWYDDTTPYAESATWPAVRGLTIIGVDSAGVRADNSAWNRDEMVRVLPTGGSGLVIHDYGHAIGFEMDGLNAGANAGVTGLAGGRIQWLEDCEIHGFADHGWESHGAGTLGDRIEIFDCTGDGILSGGNVNKEFRAILVRDCGGPYGIFNSGAGGIVENCTVINSGTTAGIYMTDTLGGGRVARNNIALDNPGQYGIRVPLDNIESNCSYSSDPLTYHTLGNYFGTPTTGDNHDSRPLLDGDYRPTAESPCRDNGSTSATSITDLSGALFHPTPSRGALEFLGIADPGLGDEQQIRWSAIATGEPVDNSAAWQPMQLDRDALRAAALASFFSDARADDDDVVPDGGHRRGWWADTATGDDFGSRLWLLSRAVITDETAARAEEYMSESLDWMLDRGVATEITVTAERVDTERISATVYIDRDEGEPLVLEFSDLWRELYA